MRDQSGRWHGRETYFGLHYDFHADENDTDIGAHTTPEELVESLSLVEPDFIQTECKGLAGLACWYSKVAEATVAPGMARDALAGWREAAKRLGVPLHCHYSGLLDLAAGRRHPDWCRLRPDGTIDSGKMCPRGGYLEKLMIPQLLELVERYEVDGFWIDGDIWAAEPCYCHRCRAAFAAKTGVKEPPLSPDEAGWAGWIGFTLESYQEYAARYCDAVHEYKDGVLVCTNWLQTLHNPGAPTVPTDWISGDTPPSRGQERVRCEARFLSTREKPWDLMLWGIYHSQSGGPWIAKPLDMLKQDAATILAFGGNLQVYENPGEVRDGRLAGWRMRRLGELGRWAKARRDLCQATETIPQVAVLISEHHARKSLRDDIFWSASVDAARGAVYAMLENHYGVDFLDEWALMPRMGEFPVVVAPGQPGTSGEMVRALKDYVCAGGRLLVTGVVACELYGEEFLGVSSVEIGKRAVYHVPAADGLVPVAYSPWGLIKPVAAEKMKDLYRTRLLEEGPLPYAAATLNEVGSGRVAYVPCCLFEVFEGERSELLRRFIGDVMQKLAGPLDVEIDAPLAIDAILRQRGNLRILHFVNRSTGPPLLYAAAAVEEIPRVGPITIRMRLEKKPGTVRAAFEESRIEWRHAGGLLEVQLENVRVHGAIVVEL